MTIRQWLASAPRNYAQGLQLYEALGTNPFLKRTLASGPGHYNTTCLLEELTALAKAGQADVEVTSVVVSSTSRSATSPASSPHQATRIAPPVRPSAAPAAPESTRSHTAPTGTLAALKAARKPLYDERTRLHAQLELTPEGEELQQKAFRILEIGRLLDASFAAERDFEATGKLPPAPAPRPEPLQMGDYATKPLALLLVERSNLRAQRSKLKKKPARAADLADVELRIAELDRLIEAANQTNPS